MDRTIYERESKFASDDNSAFWGEKGRSLLSWKKMFTEVHNGVFGNDRWFEDGELNACYNCIDRWVDVCPDKIALIFDDNEGKAMTYTYKEAQLKIFEVCHILKDLQPGDCVTVYLPMSPYAVFVVLACARLGIAHNVVFGGFSAESLRLRIQDSKSKLLISQDYCFRGEKKIDLVQTVIKAVENVDIKVLIYDSDDSSEIPLQFSRWSKFEHSQKYVEPVFVGAEHPLFYLYTSGSTGRPKGLVHTTAGYLLYCAYTLSVAFNIDKNDVFCCTADIGWITGHSYCVYGPLSLGITSVILEGLPYYPSYYRFFDIVDKYKITQLYTAPTTVRILKAYFDLNPIDTSTYNLSSLRLLGSVGEPINKEAYKFFSNIFGGLHVVDTYFQTETGGIMIAPIPNLKPAKPECATLPIPGISPRVIANELNPDNSEDISRMIMAGESAKIGFLGRIFMVKSWPGISRTILNDHERYLKLYFEYGVYFTGDEGFVDQDGDFWIMGRADDVINVSAHRISTAEVESIACTNELVSEAAVISIPHEIKGQSMVLFVVLKNYHQNYENKIKNTVAVSLGSFCKPERVIAVPGIPKTATGKIMRRVMRCIVSGRDVGDLSTCMNKDVISQIRETCSKLNLF